MSDELDEDETAPCWPCPHGGVHGADYCRLCEQNVGEDEGPDWCWICDAGGE